MQPHQQRVVDEKIELDAKISALTNFIGTARVGNNVFGGLPERERMRLYGQRRAMVEYSAILGERISDFE